MGWKNPTWHLSEGPSGLTCCNSKQGPCQVQICKPQFSCSHLKRRGALGMLLKQFWFTAALLCLSLGGKDTGLQNSQALPVPLENREIGGAPVLRKMVQPLQSLQNEGKQHPAVQTSPFVLGVSTPRAGQAVCPKSHSPGCLWGLLPFRSNGTMGQCPLHLQTQTFPALFPTLIPSAPSQSGNCGLGL